GGAATPIAGAGDGWQQGHNGVEARFSDHGLSATLLFAGATPTPSEEYVEKEEREEGDGELIFTFASSSRCDAAAAGCVWAWVRRGSGGGGGRGAGGQGGGRGARVGARRETVSPWTVLSMFLHLPELDRRLRGSTETIRLELDRAYPPPRLRADRGRRAAVDQAVVEARAQAGDGYGAGGLQVAAGDGHGHATAPRSPRHPAKLKSIEIPAAVVVPPLAELFHGKFQCSFRLLVRAPLSSFSLMLVELLSTAMRPFQLPLK
ncbi:hypothetical protein EJB05_12307, partial [Eragrostis curvula]